MRLDAPAALSSSGDFEIGSSQTAARPHPVPLQGFRRDETAQGDLTVNTTFENAVIIDVEATPACTYDEPSAIIATSHWRA
jgi:hypothetical protein